MKDEVYDFHIQQQKNLTEELKELTSKVQDVTKRLQVANDYMATFYPNENKLPVNNSTSTRVIKTTTGKNKVKIKSTINGYEKVLNAAKIVSEGMTNDFANKLMDIYPEYSGKFEKAKKAVSFHLTKLITDKKVIVVKANHGKQPGIYRIAQ